MESSISILVDLLLQLSNRYSIVNYFPGSKNQVFVTICTTSLTLAR